MDLLSIINGLSPSPEYVNREVQDLKYLHPNKSQDQLAKIWANKIRRNYTSVGIASALPSAIPGVGTAVQIAIEAGTISGDLALMLRWMGKMCMGIGFIYGNNMSMDINKDLLNILGLWCGVIQAAKEATKKIVESNMRFVLKIAKTSKGLILSINRTLSSIAFNLSKFSFICSSVL